MSADKLNQSLDDILKSNKTRRSTRPTRAGRRAVNGAKPAAPAAPVGGVKKNSRAPKPAAKATVPTGPSAGSGDSKIIVSNLPQDVNEVQIKEYFAKTIGPVKKALLTYGPNGQSRGIATIIFSKHGSASEAAKQLDGVKVDNRPMRIEVVLGAKEAPAPAPIKSLSDRVARPKNAAKDKPKPATETKAAPGKAARGRGRAGRGGRNAGRPKPKTAEELDAEMQDYFTGPAEGDTAMETNGGAVQPVANGTADAGMDDEIL